MATQEGNTFRNRLKLALDKYGLPKVEELMNDVPTKQVWSRIIRTAVNNYWENEWSDDKQQKSSMCFLDIIRSPIGKPNQIWKYVPSNTLEVKKAEVKARLVTRTYTLQSDKAKFSGYKDSDLCLLCNEEKEDTQHFLTQCCALDNERRKHLSVLKSYMSKNISEIAYSTIIDKNLLTQLLLDSSSGSIMKHLRLKEQHHRDIENISRTLCYSLHTKRSATLSGIVV